MKNENNTTATGKPVINSAQAPTNTQQAPDPMHHLLCASAGMTVTLGAIVAGQHDKAVGAGLTTTGACESFFNFVKLKK